MTLDPTALDLAARAYAAGEGWHYRPTDAPGPEHLKRAAAVLETYLAAAGPLADVEWHLELFIPGRAAPQGSKRSLGPRRMVEMSKYVGAWRDDVRAACLKAWTNQPPLDGPLVLEVEFIRKRPASAPKSYTPDANTQPDLSKLVRSTEDAITSAGVWADDARVVHTTSSKRCAEIGETPGARIRIGRRAPARERWQAEKATQDPKSTKRPTTVGRNAPETTVPAPDQPQTAEHPRPRVTTPGKPAETLSGPENGVATDARSLPERAGAR